MEALIIAKGERRLRKLWRWFFAATPVLVLVTTASSFAGNFTEVPAGDDPLVADMFSFPVDDGCSELFLSLALSPAEIGCLEILVLEESQFGTEEGDVSLSTPPTEHGGPLAATAGNTLCSTFICAGPSPKLSTTLGVWCTRGAGIPPLQLERVTASFSLEDGVLELVRPEPSTGASEYLATWLPPSPSTHLGYSDPADLELIIEELLSDRNNMAMDLFASTESGSTMDNSRLMVVIGNWKYFEERIQCVPANGQTGAKFPCSQQGMYRGLKGAKVDIYRRRSSQLDTLVFSGWTTSSTGGFMFGYYSDYYPTDKFWMVMTLSYIGQQDLVQGYYWQVVHGTENPYLYVPSFFAGTVDGVDNGTYVAVNFGDRAVPSGTSGSRDANIYASIVDAFAPCKADASCALLQSYYPAQIYHYEVSDISVCPGGGTAGGNLEGVMLCSVPLAASWAKPFLHAHEFGHHLAALLVNISPLQDCWWAPPDQTPAEGAMHAWQYEAWEEGAFQEGWAGFFAGATMFEASASNPYTYGGNSIRPLSDPPDGNGKVCVQCLDENSQPTPPLSSCEGNSARFLWDVYDSVADDYYGDSLQISVASMLHVWDSFPNCTANHCANEKNGTYVCDNGPNVYDWRYWMVDAGYSSASLTALIDSNCLLGSALD